MSCLASPASMPEASRKEAVRCLLGMVDSSGGDGSALLAMQGGVLRKVAALLRKEGGCGCGRGESGGDGGGEEEGGGTCLVLGHACPGAGGRPLSFRHCGG